MKKLLLCLLLIHFPLIAQAEITKKQALESTLRHVVQPAFVNFHAKAEVFAQVTDQFVQQTHAENLENMRNAWKALSLAWNQVRLYRFGALVGKQLTPVAYYFDSSLLKGKNFSESIHQDIRGHLKHAETDVDKLVQALGQKNFKVQGLKALEILLFDEAYPLSVYQSKPSLKIYLQAHAQVLKQRTQALSAQWQDEEYMTLLLNEAENTETKFFNALWDSLTFTRKYRVKKLFTQNKVFPMRAESWRSQFSKQNLSAWIQAFKQSFQCDSEVGYCTLLKASGYVTDAFFMQQVAQAQAAIDAVPSPLENSLLTDVEKIKKIKSHLNKVMETYARDVMDTLEVDLGFNFNDGD